VIELCNRLPDNLKLRGLSEKWLLRFIARKYLPAEIGTRRKRPYRAPIQRSFFGTEGARSETVRDVLTEEALNRSGLFNPRAVAQLMSKAAGGAPLSEIDEMAVVGIISTQLIDSQFVRDYDRRRATLRPTDRLKTVDLSA